MDTDNKAATMSMADVSRLLGISRRSAYRAATAGQLPIIRIGRRLLVPTAKLHDLLGLPPTRPTTRTSSHTPRPNEPSHKTVDPADTVHDHLGGNVLVPGDFERSVEVHTVTVEASSPA